MNALLTPARAQDASPVRRLVLTGFMGSGKTTVGRLLAAQLAWTFVDLDEHVQLQEGRTVPQIFAEQGEAAFRSAEVAALAGLLEREATVVALGGGAPSTAAVRDLLAAAAGTLVVHLDAPFDVLYTRCAAQAADPRATQRPLLGDPASAQARFAQRQPIYLQIAHHRADASLPDPAAVAEEILLKLGMRPDLAR